MVSHVEQQRRRFQVVLIFEACRSVCLNLYQTWRGLGPQLESFEHVPAVECLGLSKYRRIQVHSTDCANHALAAVCAVSTGWAARASGGQPSARSSMATHISPPVSLKHRPVVSAFISHSVVLFLTVSFYPVDKFSLFVSTNALTQLSLVLACLHFCSPSILVCVVLNLPTTFSVEIAATQFSGRGLCLPSERTGREQVVSWCFSGSPRVTQGACCTCAVGKCY